MSELDEPLVRSNIYHPRMAKTLIGHQKEFLDFVRLMKGGVLPHAWLIAGPLGIGKSTFAWKIAERLILSSVSDKSKKVELKSQIRALSAPGLLVCEKKLDSTGKKKKKFITVDEIRELKNFFSMTSLDSGWRVAIIDSGDDLNSSASNALLKILEEPPLKSIILIVSHTPARLRATIKSRCRIVNLRQLTTESKKEVFSTLGVSYSQLSKSDQTDLKILSGESVGMAINWLNNDGITLFQNCNEIIKGYPSFNRLKIIELTKPAKNNPTYFNLIGKVLLLIIYRMVLLTSFMEKTEPTQTEIDFLSIIPLNKDTPFILADLYSNVANSLNTCEDLNLDLQNELINNFILLEKTLLESGYD